MAVNSNFDTLTAQTMANYRKTLEDNIFTANPLFYWLKEQGQMKVDSRGGNKIIVPLMYGMNNTAKSYSGYDVIDVTPQDGISAAEYEWKQYAVGISLNGLEEFQNSGDKAVINMLESKIKQAEMSLIDLFAADLFKASGSIGATDIDSIPKMVSSDGTGTVGNIEADTYTWWKNYYVSGASTSVAYENIIPKTMDIILNTSKGNDRVDIGILPSAPYLGLEAQLVKTINFLPGLKNEKVANVGFDNYRIKGTTIMYDENCTSATGYFLNTKYIQLVTGAGKDFVTTPWVKPDNGDYRTCMILWYGNLVCSNRARQGTLITIS